MTSRQTRANRIAHQFLSGRAKQGGGRSPLEEALKDLARGLAPQDKYLEETLQDFAEYTLGDAMVLAATEALGEDSLSKLPTKFVRKSMDTESGGYEAGEKDNDRLLERGLHLGEYGTFYSLEVDYANVVRGAISFPVDLGKVATLTAKWAARSRIKINPQGILDVLIKYPQEVGEKAKASLVDVFDPIQFGRVLEDKALDYVYQTLDETASSDDDDEYALAISGKVAMTAHVTKMDWGKVKVGRRYAQVLAFSTWAVQAEILWPGDHRYNEYD